MARTATSLLRRMPRNSIDHTGILNALQDPVLVVDRNATVRYVNSRAEEFFDSSATNLVGIPLIDLVPQDSPVHWLIEQARDNASSLSDYGVTLETPRVGILGIETTRATPRSTR